MKDILRPLCQELRRNLSPSGCLISVTLVGSHASRSASSDSDIDLLFITINDTCGDDIVSLGRSIRKGLEDCFPDEELFLFDSPGLDRPEMVPEGSRRVQLLLHRQEWVEHSLATKNWVFISWVRTHVPLIGTDLLGREVEPSLNESLIDEFDGLPALIRHIDSTILISDPVNDEKYLAKLARNSLARVSEIRSTFLTSLGEPNRSGANSGSALNQLLATRKDVRELLDSIKRLLHKE